MHQIREDMDILFRRTLPEIVLENLRMYNRFNYVYPLKVDTKKYSYKAYEHFSAWNLRMYSSDEVERRYEALHEIIDGLESKSIFHILHDYADKVLLMEGDNLVCKIEQILNWNSIVLRLGQDIFTTAWLAWNDVNAYSSYVCKKKFTWPAVLKTDDRRLEMIFQKGLAENHFHLHGSTQNFALSWACMMNHPEYIKKYILKEKHFTENLNSSVSKGILDSQLSWDIRIVYAAMIRALLFMRILRIMDSDEVWEKFQKFDLFPLATTVRQYTKVLRNVYGAKFLQINKKKKCLDYAICQQVYDVDEESTCRLLAGERSFLYHCFSMHFKNELTEQESSLLYMYILIKSNFRSELVQCNERYGFKNFLDYQDRKNQFYEEIEEYWTESQRLSVGEAMGNNHVTMLEARIMPKNSSKLLQCTIENLKKRMELSTAFNKENLHFVIHFPKTKFSKDEFEKKEFKLVPRNAKARHNCMVKSKALHKYFRVYNKQMPYVSGIDACSAEIGCRPETFATEFRYLRKALNKRECNPWYCKEEIRLTRIGVTYHAGEDYLDILDGLRAIDEAMLFLEMGKEDRLGHAIALGIEPEYYYEQKNRNIYLTKQDCLDNIVWLLKRSLEYNITIEANYRIMMVEEAQKILNELYGSKLNLSHKVYSGDLLDLYYISWKLRGDHPELYKTGTFKEKKVFSFDEYENYMIGEKSLNNYRENEIIATLEYLYHFDSDVKLNGLKTVCYEVEDWYIQVVKEMQKALQLEVAKRKIAVECNPSSNVLISTFRRYDKHPILSLNNYHLESGSGSAYVNVSINTDDIGVFDTSLENEYALLFCAIHRERMQGGINDDNAIYEYLEYLRENGIRMSFGREENKVQRGNVSKI